MLHLYVNSILSTLESHIQSRLNLESRAIEFCNFYERDSDPRLRNKILAGIVNLSREKDIPSNYDYVLQGNSFVGKRGPLLFNMEILFVANFESSMVLDGLRYLSSVIGFFQSNTSISMPVEIGSGGSISATLSPIEEEKLDRVWEKISIPYMPSIVCKFSTIFIKDQIDNGFVVPRIDTIDIQSVGKEV